MRTDLIITIAAIIFALVILNIIFLAIIFFMRRKMAAVNQWPSTMGTVVSSGIDRRSSSDGYTDYPSVQYSYRVNGQPYQGAKIAPGMEVGSTGAGKVVARYPAGAQVMVFYNPQNPSEAVIERKAPAHWLMWLILVIFDCSLCGVIPLLWFTMK
jgi:hypothetical protein